MTKNTSWFDKLVELNQGALESGDDHDSIQHVMVSRDQLKILLDAYASKVNAGWEVDRLRAEGAYDNGRDGWAR